MDYNNINRVYLYTRFIELLLCILIISISVTQAVPIYMLYRQKAAVSEFVSIQQHDRTGIILHYAINGEWPGGFNQTDEFKTNKAYRKYVTNNNRRKSILNDTILEAGAMHYILKDGEIGKEKQITFRPAVSQGDIFGPIIWIVNPNENIENWKIFGTDKTNINSAVLGRYIQ